MPRYPAGRQNITQQIGYVGPITVTFADDAVAKVVGTLPAGATIVKPISGIQVNVAFDGSAVVDIGTLANDDLYATDLATGTVTFVPIDEAVDLTVDTDTVITVTMTGGTVTAGEAIVWLAYVI